MSNPSAHVTFLSVVVCSGAAVTVVEGGVVATWVVAAFLGASGVGAITGLGG